MEQNNNESELIKYLRDNRATYTREALDRQLLGAGHSQEAINAAWKAIEGEAAGLPQPPPSSPDYANTLKTYIAQHRASATRQEIEQRLTQAGYTPTQIASAWGDVHNPNRTRVVIFLVIWIILAAIGALWTVLALIFAPGSYLLNPVRGDDTRQIIFGALYVITFLIVTVGTIWYGVRALNMGRAFWQPLAILLVLFVAWGAAVFGSCLVFSRPN